MHKHRTVLREWRPFSEYGLRTDTGEYFIHKFASIPVYMYNTQHEQQGNNKRYFKL